MEKNPDLTTRDAVHAATMITNGLDTMISADAHFDAIRGLRRIDPATP
jgi:predicted nucleic acid-binding protein